MRSIVLAISLVVVAKLAYEVGKVNERHTSVPVACKPQQRIVNGQPERKARSRPSTSPASAKLDTLSHPCKTGRI